VAEKGRDSIMDFQLKSWDSAQASAAKTGVWLVLLTADQLKSVADQKQPWGQQAQSWHQAGLWEPKSGAVAGLSPWPAAGAKQVLLAGLSGGDAASVRKAVMAAVGAIKSSKPVDLVLSLPADAQSGAAVRAAVAAAAEASYVYTSTKPSQKPSALRRLTLAVDKASSVQAAFDGAVAQVRGVELAKEWANRPGNHAKATDLAGVAQKLARTHARMQCEVLGPKEVADLKMGSFMSVARGSDEPLRFIVLKYQGAAKSQAPVVLVGKGITFDTGGISLKPGAEMDEMKFDMCGAASVLGTFEALGHLQPKINVVGLIPACDNMPSGKATKPGDVVTSMSGQTIEILNTDAEGRLILCDALTYAERFKPHAVVDIATLTGACVIALGAVRSGLFSSNDALAQSLSDAGAASGDLCWRMPLDDEYAEGLKSNFADVANVAGRAAGSVTAAKFLHRFAKAYPWAHLDIAGTAWKSGAAKGATGRPVPLLLNYLLSQAQG
jgi:leucyl aminopeptidase